MSDIEFMLYSPEEDYEECARLSLQLFKLKYTINLPPWVLPGAKVARKYTLVEHQNSEFRELVQRAYGFWYSCDDYYLSIKYGIQDEEAAIWGKDPVVKRWSCFIPWLDWNIVRHTIYNPPNWLFFAELNGVEWKEQERAIDSCPKISFQVRDYDGEVIDATGYLEEMEWQRGRGWWKWVRHITKPLIRRSISAMPQKSASAKKIAGKGGRSVMGSRSNLGNRSSRLWLDFTPLIQLMRMRPFCQKH